MSDELTGLSRFLSYVLRHDPAAIGVRLDAGGWVDVDTLLAACAAHGRPVDLDALHAVVAGTDKQRLQLRDGRVRAAQGHSVPVDLGLEPVTPPAVLYHGTVSRFLPGHAFFRAANGVWLTAAVPPAWISRADRG
jgi:putative RNA 2'-phosphotransferase